MQKSDIDTLFNKFLNGETKALKNLIHPLGLNQRMPKTMQEYEKSESAKEGWRKYRVNYDMGNFRKKLRNSLGIKSFIKKDDSFTY